MADVHDVTVESRDAHPMGSTRDDAGLDGGSGVVDVGVDVPLPVTADDEHGVTELDEAAPQQVDGLVVGVGEQIHHLVGGRDRRGPSEAVEARRRSCRAARP